MFDYIKARHGICAYLFLILMREQVYFISSEDQICEQVRQGRFFIPMEFE